MCRKTLLLTRPRQTKLQYRYTARWSSLVARWAHNPKVVSSNLARATNLRLTIPVHRTPTLCGRFAFRLICYLAVGRSARMQYQRRGRPIRIRISGCCIHCTQRASTSFGIFTIKSVRPLASLAGRMCVSMAADAASPSLAIKASTIFWCCSNDVLICPSAPNACLR